ncbi:MAG: hydantoinase B/oxoprolinase family protein [Candidatus Rokubacteria bacterium]|nr:hydantoinase B/oxoprolinase family protein [Candidatus Rokubacteria bacterium]
MMQGGADTLDPITLEIIQEAMISVVREMRANLIATAYSSIIYEAHDFSCVLMDGAGQIIAQAEDNPSHIFPIPWSVRAMQDRFGADIHPGDVFLHNDPYTGGTHLNDIAMIYPVFGDGRLALFPVVRAHWGDVGGMTAGSISGKSTEIFHDGVRIPVLRVANRGVLDESVLDLLFANMRVPRERRGDFLSTWGTCQVAERRISEIMAKFGVDTVQEAIRRLLDRAERRMRRRIAALPDGDYVYEHYLDPVGSAGEPVKARVRVEVCGDAITVDFAGSSPQVAGPLNSGAAVAATGAFIVLKAFLDPAKPINHGNFRPITVRVPEGTFLNARYPASCAGSSEVRNAAISAVLGAMGQAVPESITGDIKGTSNHVYIAGVDPRDSEPFLFYEYPAGGTGGFPEADGNNAVRNFAEGDFGSIQPAEAVEHEAPLLVERCEVRTDSCGAGRHRGGFGLWRDIRLLADEASLSVASEKNILPPFGVCGGMPGAPNQFVVVRAGREVAPSDTPGKVAGFRLRQGDVVSVRSSGGGGWGDPLDRDPALVLADLRDGYLTPDKARSAFGVALRGRQVDEAATALLRHELRGRRLRFRLVIAAESSGAIGKRVCGLAPEAIARLGVREGEPVEIVGPAGPALRAWVQSAPDLLADSVRLGALARDILRVPEGTALEVRPLLAREGNR